LKKKILFRKKNIIAIIVFFVGINIILPNIGGSIENSRNTFQELSTENNERKYLLSDYTRGDEWNKTYGGNRSDQGYSVQQTTDSGYIIIGKTESYSTGTGFDFDFWLIKTDENGNEQWNKTFGGTEWDEGYSVQQTNDGGYILTGFTCSFGAGSADVWLIKTDIDGNEEWNKTFGGIKDDGGFSLQQTKDDGYIIVGTTLSYASRDVWVIKTDSNGSEEWNTTCGISGYDNGYSVDQTYDGGYIITGETSIPGDILLIKLDTNGIEQWKKTFGEAGFEEGNAVQQISDGGYVIVGSTNSYNATFYDIWLIKTDAAGNEEWNKTLDAGNLERGYSIKQTKDGGYIIVGITEEYPYFLEDTWLLKTDNKGNKEWDMIFGGTDEDEGRSVHQTKDGGYIITGWTGPNSGLNYDVWLIKVAAFENKRPNQPEINGKIYGKINRLYEYTMVSTDQDNDDVYYFIDWDSFDYWGNKETEIIGPFPSGKKITVNHSWHEKGNYTIKVMAIDLHGGESDWAELEVTMPKNKLFNFNFNLLKWLFDRFTCKFPILRQILVH
jgi:hypothetical protein